MKFHFQCLLSIRLISLSNDDAIDKVSSTMRHSVDLQKEVQCKKPVWSRKLLLLLLDREIIERLRFLPLDSLFRLNYSVGLCVIELQSSLLSHTTSTAICLVSSLAPGIRLARRESKALRCKLSVTSRSYSVVHNFTVLCLSLSTSFKDKRVVKSARHSTLSNYSECYKVSIFFLCPKKSGEEKVSAWAFFFALFELNLYNRNCRALTFISEGERSERFTYVCNI